MGRTARAGRAGKAVTIVTQYDIELYLRLEHDVIHRKLDLYPGVSEQEAMQFMERVAEAQVMAKRQMKELEEKSKSAKRKPGSDEEDESEAVDANYKSNNNKKRKMTKDAPAVRKKKKLSK